MDESGGFNQQDSIGFIKINAIRLMTYSKLIMRKYTDMRNKISGSNKAIQDEKKLIETTVTDNLSDILKNAAKKDKK